MLLTDRERLLSTHETVANGCFRSGQFTEDDRVGDAIVKDHLFVSAGSIVDWKIHRLLAQAERLWGSQCAAPIIQARVPVPPAQQVVCSRTCGSGTKPCKNVDTRPYLWVVDLTANEVDIAATLAHSASRLQGFSRGVGPPEGPAELPH